MVKEAKTTKGEGAAKKKKKPSTPKAQEMNVLITVKSQVIKKKPRLTAKAKAKAKAKADAKADKAEKPATKKKATSDKGAKAATATPKVKKASTKEPKAKKAPKAKGQTITITLPAAKE